MKQCSGRQSVTRFALPVVILCMALPEVGSAQTGQDQGKTERAEHASGSTQSPPNASAVPRRSGDITIEGIVLPRDEAADQRVAQSASGRTSGANPNESIVANRKKYEWSDMYARCTMSSIGSDKQRLHAVVDGEFNQSRQVYAQDFLARRNASCTQHPYRRHLIDPPELGYSIYDRGAFLIQAIRTFAPDLKLTRQDTGDTAVQSRFNLREVPRNKYRLPVDYQYFATAVCAVRLQPTLSVALVTTPYAKVKTVSRIENAIVDGSRICFGNAKKVFFDPTQFRIYIADAVYRWAVAARGVDSLIPLE
jgi:hypothetical protein